ncbi:MAG: hypothetical protein ACOYJ2_00745 [Rickettsiales bacterium]
MIALLSALVGFISSGIPEFIKLFRESKDRSHEITLMKLQMEYDREKLAAARESEQLQRAVRLQEIEVQADIADTRTLSQRVSDSRVGIAWVDALAGSVRPTITYLFFLLYALTKWAQYQLLVASHQSPVASAEAIILLWTQDDMAIFTAIIAFWFGQRMIARMKRAL